MDIETHSKFTDLLSKTLSTSNIKYVNSYTGEAYVVYNNDGIMFTITFRNDMNKYEFTCTNLFKSQYAKHGLASDIKLNYAEIFSTVAFAYKIEQMVIRAQKDFSTLYNDILIDSDVIYQMRGDFETYMVTNSGIAGFAIGHNKKTGQYGFKRYELVNTLYTVCSISPDKKPNYAKLYQRVKDQYMAQVAMENIQHLYDF